jgi:hypothetical protein
LTDAQRADRVRAFELGLVDETLTAERARIEASLQDCPGSGSVAGEQALAPSVGDKPRDTVRIHAQGDPVRMASVAQIALADWRLRRARATGDASFCDGARAALAAVQSAETPPDLLSGLGMATVSRDAAHAGAVTTVTAGEPASLALSNYALGFVDTVQAVAPLPQYLAAVYGGVVLGTAAAPALQGATPEALVDRFAPAYPDWEPDALYAVLVQQ